MSRDIFTRHVANGFLRLISVSAKRTLDRCFMRPTLGFDLPIIPLLEYFFQGRNFAEINICLWADKSFGNHFLKLMYSACDY